MKGTDGATLIAYCDNAESFIGLLATCQQCAQRWLITAHQYGTVYLGIKHGRRYWVAGWVACPECSGELSTRERGAVRTDVGHALVLPLGNERYYLRPRVGIQSEN